MTKQEKIVSLKQIVRHMKSHWYQQWLIWLAIAFIFNAIFSLFEVITGEQTSVWECLIVFTNVAIALFTIWGAIESGKETKKAQSDANKAETTAKEAAEAAKDAKENPHVQSITDEDIKALFP